VRVLSRIFRGKLLAFLKLSYRHGELCFPGKLAELSTPRAFHSLLGALRRREWVVYSKPPFGGPEHVLKYLAATPIGLPSPTEDSSVSITDRCASDGETPDMATAAAP
jgi:Putative transposase